MNPNNQDVDNNSVDCCICLNAMAPFQALFLAPCSHCFHYTCVTPLLGQGFMFQCPMCRQVANLEAAIATDDLSESSEEVDMIMGGSDDENDPPVINNYAEASSGGKTRIILSYSLVNRPKLIGKADMHTITAADLLTNPLQSLILSQTPENNVSLSSLDRQPFPLILTRLLSSIKDSLNRGNEEDTKDLISQYSKTMKEYLINATAISNNDLGEICMNDDDNDAILQTSASD